MSQKGKEVFKEHILGKAGRSWVELNEASERGKKLTKKNQKGRVTVPKDK